MYAAAESLSGQCAVGYREGFFGDDTEILFGARVDCAATGYGYVAVGKDAFGTCALGGNGSARID